MQPERIQKKIQTPWGKTNHVYDHGDGVIFTETARHGGFRIERKHYLEACARENVPVFPKAGGQAGNFVWFEEDCDWAFAVIAFPHVFDEETRKGADATLRNWYPEQWEELHGEKIEEGQSRKRDEQIYRERHANDYQGVAASRMGSSPLILVHACRGGRDENGRYANPVNTYLVSEDRYDSRDMRFNYLIQDGDIRVNMEEVAALKQMISDAWKSESGQWLVRSVTVKDDGMLSLACSRPANDEEIRRFEVTQEDWEKRGDIRKLYAVSENGVVEEFIMPEVEEESEDFSVSP